MLGVAHLLLMAGLFGFLRWRGVGFWGAVCASAPATLFVFFTWKAIPIYKQHHKLLAALEEMDPGGDRGAIKEMLARNGWTFITDREIRKIRSKDEVGLKVEYAGVIQVTPQMRVEIRFDNLVKGKGGTG